MLNREPLMVDGFFPTNQLGVDPRELFERIVETMVGLDPRLGRVLRFHARLAELAAPGTGLRHHPLFIKPVGMRPWPVGP